MPQMPPWASGIGMPPPAPILPGSSSPRTEPSSPEKKPPWHWTVSPGPVKPTSPKAAPQVSGPQPEPVSVPGTAFAEAEAKAAGKGGTEIKKVVKAPPAELQTRPMGPVFPGTGTSGSEEFNPHVPEELPVLPIHPGWFGTAFGPDGQPMSLLLVKAAEDQIRREKAAHERYCTRILMQAAKEAKAAVYMDPTLSSAEASERAARELARLRAQGMHPKTDSGIRTHGNGSVAGHRNSAL